MTVFKGVYTALVTPFKDDKIDDLTFQTLIERQIENGVHGIIPVGTTGESATLDDGEHWHLFDLAIEAANGRVPVVVGCGSNDTKAAIRHMEMAKKAGADGALVVAPYYNKPSQAGLIAHFNTLANAVDLPIMVYNIPGRTNVDIVPDTMAEIAKHPNIVALKDSAGDPSRTVLHLARIHKPFSIFAGDDHLALAFAAYGAVGCVSVLANIMPKECAQLQDLMAAEKMTQARALNQQLDPLQRALFLEPNPGPAKFALSIIDLCAEDVRLPLVPPNTATRGAVQTAMIASGALRGN
ncbi:4-hydroxy-tetrahydrodipicolinate synthase [Candidatus Phycosocius spiralis]|uniref:4-hydroxy-tetrahydrodipicolinate synthase n=1 Tax=Candidatus Phycosocius spiralis TaxID=2815099 RepID=A0ABQ4PWJ0_9PROT|nr:4-hydroxy-tetrahydrodipicolinate synthase [Candidatus Phycosocius spiralis]GIU67406.1 4-hydroxy-tetrahydrodipicolinate synthase [Candidatus Phycosocius spiralis]